MNVATVMSGSGWEPRFVRAAREGGGVVKVWARCATAGELATALPNIEAVIIGADVAWMGRRSVEFWHNCSVAVVGIAANSSEQAMLRQSGCDAVFDRRVRPCEILGVTAAAATGPHRGTVTAVGGARGTPGCTEVALGIAWAAARHGSVLLVEADTEAPSLGLRLGLPPSNGLTPARVGPIEVVALPVRPGPLSRSVLDRFLIAASERYALIVLDCGPHFERGLPVMVVDPSPVALIRAAQRLAAWRDAPPLLVANRANDVRDIRKIRAATGLEPSAVVPLCDLPEDRPSPLAISALEPVVADLLASGQRAAL